MSKIESLFKQRIKKARKQQQNKFKIEQSFPKALAINTSEKQQVLQEQWIQQLKNKSGLPISELNIIQRQNIIKINQMREQERNMSIAMINSSIPPSLINKMKKKSEMKSQVLKEPIKDKNQNNHYTPQKNLEQNMDEENQITDTQNINLIRKMRVCLFIDKLFFNTHENLSDENVSLGQIQDMLHSNNNQSIIIGSRLVYQIIRILNCMPHLHNIIIVSSVTMHFLMVIQDLYKYFLIPLMQKLTNSLFATCYFEMLINLCHITTLVFPLIGLKKQLQIKNVLMTEKNRIQIIGNSVNQQTRTNLQLQIETVIQFTQKEYLPQDQNIEVGISNMPIIVNRMMSEHFMSQYYQFKPFINTLTVYLKQQNQSNRLVDFFYTMIIHLKNQKDKFHHWETLYLQLKKIVFVTLQKNLEYYQQTTQIGCFVKILYTLHELQSDYLKQFSHKSKSISIEQFYAIIYVSIENYCQQKVLKQEVQSVNGMCKWLISLINDHILQPGVVLMDILCIFSSKFEIYLQLNQQTLNQLFKTLTHHISFHDLIKITSNKINQLIQNYSFGSFGNNVFSRVILFLFMKVSEDIQHLILVNLLQRHVYLFYLACNDEKYGDPQLYKYRSSNSQEKQQVLNLLKSHQNLVQFPNIISQIMNPI